MSDSKLILVTGGAGFIGSRLCERLVTNGHKVISLDNYFTGSKENHIEGVDYREGHTKDIKKHVSETPDLVYHLGEYSRVERSFKEPGLVWDLNIVGTLGVLEFCREKKCKIVYAGSSTKFSNNGQGRFQSPYAWSKATNTDLVANYGNWFDLPYSITYFYNVYGPGERNGTYGTVIEIFRQQYLAQKPLTVRLPGTQERNFTHIDDIVDGLLLVGEKGEGKGYGLGASETFSVLEVAKLFTDNIEMLPNQAGNRLDAPLDTKNSRALGWSQKRKLADYIESQK